jgi:hypothetical protein
MQAAVGRQLRRGVFREVGHDLRHGRERLTGERRLRKQPRALCPEDFHPNQHVVSTSRFEVHGGSPLTIAIVHAVQPE